MNTNNFIDYVNHVSKQTFSAAVITDSKGKQVGKIVIRFTGSQIGYNHEVGVVFYPADINFSSTRKGNTYGQPGSLYYLLRDAGVKMYNFSGNQVIDYDMQKKGVSGQNYDSMSRFDEIVKLKFNRKSYNVLWCM
jgi:hypothetical protein